jgi:hypothetical protein
LEQNRKILRKIILPGTSDLDITGVEGDFKGLEYIIYEPTEGVHEILNVGLEYEDQVWMPPIFPDYSKCTKKECQDIYIREIKRITYGIYVWIGGELEYITGDHYGFMCHWKLKEATTDYAIYTETQRNVFYMYDLCASDPKCVGAIIFSLKRLGKSETAQAEMYMDALKSDKGRYIVQALNDDEAIDIFNKTHYANENIHHTLPVWPFKINKTEPVSEALVALKRDSTKDSIVWKSADGIEGSNEVSFVVRPTKLLGIQGKKIRRAFLDEFASLKPVKDMTLANYHSKAVAQCTEDFGSIVLGKIWLIATAENLDSESLVDARDIWDGSAEDKKDANGFTASKLKRMFIPYYLGGRGSDMIDKFGRPKIKEAKQFYENSIAIMSDKQKALFRRQNPETIKDVFEIEFDGGLEADVVEIIKHRRRELVLSKAPQPMYNISKYNGEVRLDPTTKEGQFTVEIFEHPQEHHTYRVGIDATSTAINSTNKAANGGEQGKEKSKFALVVHKITGDNQYVDVANIWVRPEKRHLIEKAGMWLCEYYNKYGKCRAYPERNASAGSTLTDLFEAEGNQKILIRQLKKHNTDKLMEKSTDAYGIYIDGNNKDYRTSIMNKYLRVHGHKINSIRVCDNLLLYGLENADLADAYGVGTMACGNFDPETVAEKIIKDKIYYENVLGSDGRFKKVKRVISKVNENS